MSDNRMDGSAEAVWRSYNDAANRQDLERVRALVAPDLSVTLNGQLGVSSADDDEAAMAELLASYPDFRRVVEGVLAAGPCAAIRWRMLGTPVAAGLPPLDVSGCSVVEVAGGVIVDAHLYYDGAALDNAISRSKS